MLTDEHIARLLAEGKSLVEAGELLRSFHASAPKHGSRRSNVLISGALGTGFVLQLRQSVFDAYDFSVILLYQPFAGSPVILRRHNGRTHPHRNKLEGNRLSSDFHVHMATERYQAAGLPIDGYAERTSEFFDLATALDAMLRVANFETSAQGSLLE